MKPDWEKLLMLPLNMFVNLAVVVGPVLIVLSMFFLGYAMIAY